MPFKDTNLLGIGNKFPTSQPVENRVLAGNDTLDSAFLMKYKLQPWRRDTAWDE
jgi:hypothetical protein